MDGLSRGPLGLPPLSLANRVGDLGQGPDRYLRYLQIGSRLRRAVLETLPRGWTFEGKRVLDFGAGAGRMLRHFVAEAEVAEIWGCDIDEASVDWMKAHLEPPFVILRNDEVPPLPVASGHFDLIIAVSVFTHLTSTWSAWLVELHRLLAPDGLLVSTFMGEGMSKWLTGEAWDEDRVGMSVFNPDQPWDLGGPMVLHSPWWLRARWSRAFQVEAVKPMGFGTGPSAEPAGHGVVLARRLDVEITPADLERPSDDPRELTASLAARDTPAADPDRLRAAFDHLGPWYTQHVIRGNAYGGPNSYATDTRVPTFLEWAGPVREVLELGSFEAAHTLQLAAADSVERVIGLEGREANLQRARFVLGLLPDPKVTLHRVDVESDDLCRFLPVESVFCAGVLYHLTAPWALLRRLAGGTTKLFLDTHYAESAEVEVNGYRGRWFDEGGPADPLSGLSERSFWPTLDELRRMCRDCGFVERRLVDRGDTTGRGPRAWIYLEREETAASPLRTAENT